MRKIAVVCNYILKLDRVGGMDRFFRLFDEQLKETGCRVDWFFSDYTAFEFYDDLNIYSAKNSSVEKKFLDITASQKYDVVITHFTELCTKFYKETKKKNSESYIIAVDHNPRPLKGFPLKKKIKKRIKSFLYAKYINQFIAVSKYSKQHLMNDFGSKIKSKIQIVYNGLLLNNLIKKEDYNYRGHFIVACHLRKEKGIQHLIKAIKLLENSEQEKIKIDIYGEGPYSDELELLVKTLSLDTAIKFKGSVSNLHETYHQYDYLIHPSLGETFCYSVVESLLCNLPVITTKNAGNVLGLVKNELNGFIFNEKDEDKLALILKNIITNKKRINKIDFELVKLPDLSLNNMVNNHINLLP